MSQLNNTAAVQITVKAHNYASIAGHRPVPVINQFTYASKTAASTADVNVQTLVNSFASSAATYWKALMGSSYICDSIQAVSLNQYNPKKYFYASPSAFSGTNAGEPLPANGNTASIQLNSGDAGRNSIRRISLSPLTDTSVDTSGNPNLISAAGKTLVTNLMAVICPTGGFSDGVITDFFLSVFSRSLSSRGSFSVPPVITCFDIPPVLVTNPNTQPYGYWLRAQLGTQVRRRLRGVDLA